MNDRARRAPTMSCAFLLFCATAAADEDASVPDAQFLEQHHAVIGEIFIDNANIFDPQIPEEDRYLYRLANRLHFRTKPKVIQRQLLFKTGDEFEQRLLDESERNLRSNSYLHDAWIEPIEYHDNTVDILVHTIDVWTLDPRLSFGRSGGTNTINIGIKDANFLGTGIYFGLFQKNTVDRDSTQFIVRDEQLGNTHYFASGRFEDNSDGQKIELAFGRPFYQLESHKANDIHLLNDERVDSLWNLGEVQDKFYHDINYYNVSYGLSRGLVNNWVNRYSAGFTYDENNFAPYTDEKLPYDLVPADRKFVYPYLEWELLEDRYETATNHDQIGQTEDRYLGTRVAARLGYASESLGSSANATIMDLALHLGYGHSASNSLITDYRFHTRLQEGSLQDSLLQLDAIFHHRHSEHSLLHMALTGNLGYNLDLDHQILLGGDNGLRGYPLRYQGGDASALLTLEERLYTDWYPFHLIHVGAAAFFDIGRTWGVNPVGGESLGWLSDAGIGFRFGNDRSGIGRVVHLDFAFPLNAESDISSFQILLKGKASF